MAGSGAVAQELSRAGVTAREAEVLSAVAARLTNREIAERLYVSVRTVESHVSALLRKLGAADRGELIRRGAQVQQQARTHDLPEPVTSFVGRVRELADLAGLLAGTRLLTLTGPGGVGKTRLALRAAVDSSGEYPDGVALVDFAALASGTLVTEAVARALGVAEQPGRPIADTLRAAVAHTEALLVADNCEHVIDDVARCLAGLLPAGRLRILATSREPLGVPGETVYDLRPLAVPRPHGATAPQQLAECDAVRLFTDRAASAAPGFALTDANAEAVAELCRRLDGLPLAVELAAARVRAFSPHHLVAHLDRRFDLLTAGARTAPARHRTLAATIRWSHDALDDDERVLFERLAVFPGTFDYDAVEAVCRQPPLDRAATITAFPRLLDKSLVSSHQAGAQQVRYQLLETLRVYASQRLPAAAAASLQERHAAHYLAVAETAAPRLKGPDQHTWLARLAAEQANLRAALAWSVQAGQIDTALRLLSALALYWDDSGQRREAADWIDQILAAGDLPPTPAGVDALAAASVLLQASDVEQAGRLARTAAELAQRLGDRERAVAALALGWASAYQGRGGAAVTALGRALAFFDAQAHPWERASTLQGLALATADLDQAIAYAQQAAVLFQHVDDRSRYANTLYTMADGALNAGVRLDDAHTWLEHSLQVSQAAGTEHDRVHALLGLARLAWQRDSLAEAQHLLDECLPTLRRLGDQRCTGRSLQMLGELAARSGHTTLAGELLRQSLQAAEPAADEQTLAQARRALARLHG